MLGKSVHKYSGIVIVGFGLQLINAKTTTPCKNANAKDPPMPNDTQLGTRSNLLLKKKVKTKAKI
jgi:hypothetical protein